jgi:hypothetical protein
MGEEGGPRKHCRDPLLPRGDTARTHSTKGWKCDTTRDCRLRIAPLRPMPPTNECTYSSAPTRERSSTVLGPVGPRCAAGSIQGPRLRVGLNAEPEQRYDRKGWHTGSHHRIPFSEERQHPKIQSRQTRLIWDLATARHAFLHRRGRAPLIVPDA